MSCEERKDFTSYIRNASSQVVVPIKPGDHPRPVGLGDHDQTVAVQVHRVVVTDAAARLLVPLAVLERLLHLALGDVASSSAISTTFDGFTRIGLSCRPSATP